MSGNGRFRCKNRCDPVYGVPEPLGCSGLAENATAGLILLFVTQDDRFVYEAIDPSRMWARRRPSSPARMHFYPVGTRILQATAVRFTTKHVASASRAPFDDHRDE
jgi:hypothetical protein